MEHLIWVKKPGFAFLLLWHKSSNLWLHAKIWWHFGSVGMRNQQDQRVDLFERQGV